MNYLSALDRKHPSGRPPWALGRREEATDVEHVGAREVKAWCLTEVDIFRDLNADEMEAIASAAPMKTYAAGEMLYSPHNPTETLFILKSGRRSMSRFPTSRRRSLWWSGWVGHVCTARIGSPTTWSSGCLPTRRGI